MPDWRAAERLIAAFDRGDAFHVTDTETTGASPRGARVIELATVTLRCGAIVDRFETLIDPGVRVPSMITQLTGISTAMLAGAPAPAAALDAWLAYLGGQGHFVAHNAPFDWGFLTAECQRTGVDWPFAERICTVSLARQCLPELPSRSLGALVAHYGLVVDAAHRALADAEATAVVFLSLIDQLRAGLRAREGAGDLVEAGVERRGVDRLVRPKRRQRLVQ